MRGRRRPTSWCPVSNATLSTISRRGVLKGIAAAAFVGSDHLGTTLVPMGSDPFEQATPTSLPPAVLPPGIRSRFVDNVNGLRMHILEAGFETAGRPAVLMIHGFPELAYSWRKVMGPVAAAGYHVFAPDVRGYGRTSGADAVKYSDDLRPFGTFNRIRDMIALVAALGYRTVNVVGHDQGSPLAGC